MTRARPLSPADRRRSILEAALPIVKEHGKAVTTRQIAAAVGIAEGTLFRVFATKEELFDALIEKVLDPEEFLEELRAISPEASLRDRLTQAAEVMHRRFRGNSAALTALGVTGPPPRRNHRRRPTPRGREESYEIILELLAPDADHFRLPVEDVVRLLRMLTFSATHPHHSEDTSLTPAQIVDVIAHGTLRPEAGAPCDFTAASSATTRLQN